MYPDLLEIFGITLHGVMFERILWGAGSLLMLWGVLSSILIFLQGRKGEAVIQGVIVTPLLIWLFHAFLGTFAPDYALTFRDPVVLHTYAFCILVGIVFGILSGMSFAPYRGIDRTWYAKLCLWFVLIGFVGARAIHVLVDAPFYMASCFEPATVGLAAPDCLRVFRVSEGGLTFYGGVIAGFVVLIIGVLQLKKRRPRFSFLTLTDLLAMSLAVTHGFGRIGCLAAGCCWGAVTQSGFGIHYDHGSFAYNELIKDPRWAPLLLETHHTPALHPTQIYEACAEFLIFAILFFIGYRQNKRLAGRLLNDTADGAETARDASDADDKKAADKDRHDVRPVRPGRMTAIWFIGYGLCRFVVEMMRDDTERGYFFQKKIAFLNRLLNVDPDHVTVLTTSQGIAIFMVCFGMVCLALSRRREL